MTDARAAVLGRIRAATGPARTVPEVPRTYRLATGAEADLDLFCSRVRDYHANVHRVRLAELDAVLEHLALGRVGIPAALTWQPAGAEIIVDDPPLTLDELDGLDAALTGCVLAIAETGTLVLDGSGECGRRVLTLIPDRHVCVLHRHQLVAGVPDAIAKLPRDHPLTFVSGPSATSDIELQRVEGVHGPRRIDVVLIEDD